MNFDLEDSRGFLRSWDLPETLVIDFAELWDSHFRIDYRCARAQLKDLALRTYNDVRGALLICHEDWDAGRGCEGRVAFVDDDDWMSPKLFESLPAMTVAEDGVRWGSLRVGRVFSESGYSGAIIQRRPLDHVVYTNNYAVTSRALHRFGRAALFEHVNAQAAFNQSDFALSTSEEYLSCAVKHPCCTGSARFPMSMDRFRNDPRAEMSKFMDAVDVVRLEELPGWLEPVLN